MSDRTQQLSAIEQVAKVCHQANKTWCELNGDFSQKDWHEAEEWQKQSAINGVLFKVANPDSGHDAQHNNWMKVKQAEGWVYGEVKDPIAKTHPCMVPFEELPEFQQKKDALFGAIVLALNPEVVPETADDLIASALSDSDEGDDSDEVNEQED